VAWPRRNLFNLSWRKEDRAGDRDIKEKEVQNVKGRAEKGAVIRPGEDGKGTSKESWGMNLSGEARNTGVNSDWHFRRKRSGRKK